MLYLVSLALAVALLLLPYVFVHAAYLVLTQAELLVSELQLMLHLPSLNSRRFTNVSSFTQRFSARRTSLSICNQIPNMF